MNEKIHTYDIDAPWRVDTPWDKYKQYCRIDELELWNPKLCILLRQYDSCFDDYWMYWLSLRNKLYVRRTPLFIGQKRMAAEKPKSYRNNGQQQLLEAEVRG
jgi:hypothetical protein